MYTALICLMVLGGDKLQDIITPISVTQSPTLVDNMKVQSTQVTIEIDPSKVAELEKLGQVLDVVTLTQDKYPVPELEIVADENIQLGDLVLLELQGEIPQGVTRVDVTWKVLEIISDDKSWKWQERRIKISDDNRSCFFGAGIAPNRYLAIANVTFLYVDGTNYTSTSKMTSSEIVVGTGPTPPPQPVNPVNPVNPVKPEPSFPPGKYNISKLAYDARGNMSKAQAELLIKAYETTLTEVVKSENAPRYGKVDAPLNRDNVDDVSRFSAVLTDHRTRVQDLFKNQGVAIPTSWTNDEAVVTKAMFQAWENRTLQSLVDYNTFVGELISALREIKERAQ